MINDNSAILHEMKHDVDMLNNILINILGIEYVGGDRYISNTDPLIRSMTDIDNALERYLIVAGLIRAGKNMKYWQQAMDRCLCEMRRRADKAAASKLAYDPTIPENDDIDKLLIAMTGRADDVQRAVIKHFIWQIKRKMNEQPVSYHMMPILWGKQKSGKSLTITKLLAPLGQYVYNGLTFAQAADDRYYRSFSMYYVFFFDEMRKADKTDVDGIKNVITSPTLTYRVLAKNDYVTIDQRATFIGVSNLNPNSLIKDDTGMRRFYYIETLDKMDFELISTINFENIWKTVDENRATAYIIDHFDSIDSVQDKWRNKTIIELFFEEGDIVKSEGAEVPATKVYEAFVNFSKEQGHKFPMTKANFEKALMEQHAAEFYTLERSATSRVRMLKGYQLTVGQSSVLNGKISSQLARRQ